MTTSRDPRTTETMPDTDHDRTDAPRSDDGSSDDTVEITTRPSLADDLLRGGTAEGYGVEAVDGSTDGPGLVDGPGQSDGIQHTRETGRVDGMIMGKRAADPPDPDPDDDDDYLEPDTRRRSRLTTALLVALIFALGTLTGVLVGRVLTPAPTPRIVYLLNDAPTSAPSTSALPSPTPSVSR